MKQIVGLGIALLSSLGYSLPAHGAAQLFTCTPYGAGESISPFIYIRCSNVQIPSVVRFAVSTADHDRAARVLALAAGALLAGRAIDIVYDPNDLSGVLYGCGDDCRPLLAAELK